MYAYVMYMHMYINKTLIRLKVCLTRERKVDRAGQIGGGSVRARESVLAQFWQKSVTSCLTQFTVCYIQGYGKRFKRGAPCFNTNINY